MFFGHIIDNVRHTKQLFVGLEFFSCIWFIIMGTSFIHDYNEDNGKMDSDELSWSQRLFPVNFFLISGIQILQLIQLFNWFSKRRLATVIGIWFLVQQVGYACRFLFEGEWQYFPHQLADFKN